MSYLSVSKNTNLGWILEAVVENCASSKGAQTIASQDCCPTTWAETDWSLFLTSEIVKLTIQGVHDKVLLKQKMFLYLMFPLRLILDHSAVACTRLFKFLKSCPKYPRNHQRNTVRVIKSQFYIEGTNDIISSSPMIQWTTRLLWAMPESEKADRPTRNQMQPNLPIIGSWRLQAEISTLICKI